MIALGITGHQRRPTIDWVWVRGELARLLAISLPLDCLWSCLAPGADTIAAEEAMRLAIPLKAIIPHENYGRVFGVADRKHLKTLLAYASQTIQLAPGADRQQCYLTAGYLLADKSDSLVAVWDGKPAVGTGGTGDVVTYARSMGKRILWINTTNKTVEHL